MGDVYPPWGTFIHHGGRLSTMGDVYPPWGEVYLSTMGDVYLSTMGGLFIVYLSTMGDVYTPWGIFMVGRNVLILLILSEQKHENREILWKMIKQKYQPPKNDENPEAWEACRLGFGTKYNYIWNIDGRFAKSR